MDLLNLGAFSIADFCSEVKNIVQIVGYILMMFKIAIPLIIVAFGIFDFGKAVVAEKEDEIKKQTKRLVYRLIAGVVIFLIPNLIIWIFGAFVDDYEKQSEEFKTCETCFLKPRDC